MGDVLLQLFCLIFVFILFAFFYFRQEKRETQGKNLRKEMEIVAREVINDYGRILAREEARKVYNEAVEQAQKRFS